MTGRTSIPLLDQDVFDLRLGSLSVFVSTRLESLNKKKNTEKSSLFGIPTNPEDLVFMPFCFCFFVFFSVEKGT